ncbi:hypothetical protein Y032_0141g2206 [Ancylostoma ceylanicum]|uniref:Uncharacterized protein n=1 Tax=Ancylostoma ceylanicum TaxID=53326 RepID=A0A016T2V3_9BILA|nr:hypothetical protein Y032_0141g2206 [Ancylostoma ceylanicum]
MNAIVAKKSARRCLPVSFNASTLKEEPGFRGHERAARSRRGVRLDRLPSGPVFSPSCEDDSSELGSALVTSLWGLFYVMGTELCERNHCLLVENRRTNGTVEWSGINSIQRCK